MQDAEIRELLSRAETIVRDVDERYRTVAFEVVLGRLLTGGISARPRVQVVAGRELPGTVSEFLALAEPANHPETAVCVAYYMWRSGDPGGMTVEELLAAYAQRRAKKPRNPSDALAKAARKGHLIEASERKNGKKAWVITQAGEVYVEARLEQRRTGR